MAEFAKSLRNYDWSGSCLRADWPTSLAYQRALSICMNAETAAPISRRRK